MEKRKNKIYVYGDATIDFKVKVPSEMKFNKDGLFLSPIEMLVAGDAGTVAQQLALLNQHVFFIGNVGNDYFGKVIINKFKKLGIDTKRLNQKKDKTGKNIILYYNNTRRSILCDFGAHINIQGLKINSDCKAIYIPSFDCYYNLFQQINKKRNFNNQNDAPIIITDFGFHSKVNSLQGTIKKLEKFIDICSLSGEHFSLKDRKKVEQMMFNSKIKICIITLGGKGVSLVTKEKKKSYKAYKAKNIVDVCGAGNSFLCGFILAYSKGRKIDDCVNYGQATAILRIQNMNKLPTEKEVNEFMSKQKK